MIKIDEKECEANGLRWFYREVNPEKPRDVPPVVLLHGLVSQSYSWRDVMKPLAAAGYRAIAPDWIGHGYSSKPSKSEFSYKPEALLTAFDSWLTSLEIDRCTLVVQGFLGSVGLLWAAQNPDRIERLIILNTPLSSAAKLPSKVARMGWPLLGQVLTQDPLLVDRILEGGGPYAIADDDLDVYRRPFLKSSDAGFALLATIQQLQLSQTVAAINQGFENWKPRTLIAWGTADKWLPVSEAKNFAKKLDNADIKTLEETGHYAQEDWAEKVSEAIIEFIRGM